MAKLEDVRFEWLDVSKKLERLEREHDAIWNRLKGEFRERFNREPAGPDDMHWLMCGDCPQVPEPEITK